MPWGTHFCHFYETKQDLLEILVPYFEAGLQNNEFCLWVIAAPLSGIEATLVLQQAVPNLDQHLTNRNIEIQVVGHKAAQSLSRSIPNLERHLNQGSIEIIPHDQWYLKHGVFDSCRLINRWKAKLNQALARGFAGMRVLGNESWLTEQDWGSFLDYEMKLEQVLADQKMLVLCTYPLSTSKAGQVFDVARAHDFVIAKRHGHWETLKTPELKHTKGELAAVRRSEQAVRESQRLLELVLATLPVGVAVTDRKGDIVLANAAAERIWGHKVIVSGRERWAKSKGFWHESGQRIARADWASARALAKGQTSLDELVDIETFGGQRKIIQNSAAPIRNAEGQIVGAVIVNEDITKRVRAEEAQAELARVARWTMMGELTASIAHEISQPLVGVISNANAVLQWLAASKPKIREAQKAVRHIARDGKRAAGVIARVRELLRKGERIRGPVNLNPVIRATISLLRRELRRKTVALRLELSSGLPRVTADRVQLQQVVMNLVMNSVDAMTEVAEPRRVLSIRTVHMKSRAVCVEIRDGGIGVNPAQAKRLFEPFFTTKSDGLGLGLAISRSIIEAHGGRLWATHNRGPGMTFHFTLPGRTGGGS